MGALQGPGASLPVGRPRGDHYDGKSRQPGRKCLQLVVVVFARGKALSGWKNWGARSS